jgi:hypothetical protein
MRFCGLLVYHRLAGNYCLITSSHDSHSGCRDKDREVGLLSAIISTIALRPVALIEMVRSNLDGVAGVAGASK